MNKILDDIPDFDRTSIKNDYAYAAGYWYESNKSAKKCNEELISICRDLFNIVENKEEASCVEIRILKDRMERFRL